MASSPFLFVTSQVGAGPALKKEMSVIAPNLRFAYSRPGFLTFKKEDGTPLSPDFQLHDSTFARAHGVSLEKISNDPARIVEIARQIGHKTPLRLHFWERDRFPHGKTPPDYIPGQLPEKLVLEREKLLSDPAFFKDTKALPGDLVLDVVVVEETEWWVGLHRCSDFHSAYPGGWPEIALPDDSPSRAYLKLEEAVATFSIPLQKNDVAIEIGSSPGGCTFALLQRGLHVTGIDPRSMDSRLIQNSAFHWMRRPVGAVKRDELPPNVQWILLDMNVEPREALQAAERLISYTKESLQGVLLTVKLTDWAFADEIPQMIANLKRCGITQVRSKQLAFNGQEFLLYGLTQAGLKKSHS